MQALFILVVLNNAMIIKRFKGFNFLKDRQDKYYLELLERMSKYFQHRVSVIINK